MRAAFLAAGGLAAAAIGVPSAFAQEDDMAVPVVTSVDEDPATEAYPELLENTLSVEGDIDDDAVPRTTLATPQPELTPWFAFKQRFEARTGISFGGSYGVLAQIYSDSLAGSGLPTAATWGDFNLGITQAYIRQSVAGGKFQYTVGKIFAPNFVNPYPFFDDNRQFLRLAFSTSPTIATPCAARVSWWRPIRAGAIWEIYVKAGMFTANSDDTGWTVDDFFGRDEHFYFVEVGATSFARRPVPIHARGPMDRNNIHVTMWYRDPLEPRGPGDITRPQDKAYGIAFNINQMANDNMMWFLRGGLGTGGFAEINLTGGLGYRPNSRTGDLLGVGVGWSKPDDAQIPIPLPFNPRDQLTAEVFYRLAITPNIAITQLAREFDTIRESIPPAIEQAQAFVERIGLGGAASNLLEEGGSDLSGYAARAGSYVLTAGNGLAYRGWPERVR